MANPNKTVLRFRRAAGGFPPKPPRERSPFMAWFFDQVQRHGRSFDSMEEAEAEFSQLGDASPQSVPPAL